MKIDQLFNISGKVAVVTGGSRGIGEMISAGFLANGVKVYITARKEEPLVKKAEELSNKYNGVCIPIACDLSSTIGIDYFVKMIHEKENPSLLAGLYNLSLLSLKLSLLMTTLCS